jgi:hypothetical protein
MGLKLNNHPEDRFNRASWELFDDFTSYTDAGQWTKVLVGTGTVAHEGDAGRSCVKLFCTAANDAAVLATTDEIVKFTASKAIVAECRVIFTDVNTDDGHVFFGCNNLADGTQMADTTGAITATDAIGIYKLPDTTKWAFHTEINGSITGLADATTGTTSSTTAGGSAFQVLRWELLPRSATVFEARPFVDGVQLETSTGLPIMHTVTLGTATEMHFQLMTKSNHANDFNVFVDYMYLGVVR